VAFVNFKPQIDLKELVSAIRRRSGAGTLDRASDFGNRSGHH
jgi:hypothetical protein